MLSFSEFNNRFSAKFNKKLKKLCDPLFTAFGMNSFYYQAIKSDGNFLSICTDVELMDHYFVGTTLYRTNPFITQFSQIKSGLFMPEMIDDEELHSSHLELREKYGVHYFSLIVRKEGNVCHEFGFGRPEENKKTELLFLNQLGLIHKFINHFERELNFVINEMHHNPVSLKKDPALYEKKLIIPTTDLNLEEKEQFLNALGLSSEPNIQLTRREKNCADELLKGKTAAEIAASLHLSPRTVEHYLQVMKDKLDCKNKSELFSKLQAQYLY